MTRVLDAKVLETTLDAYFQNMKDFVQSDNTAVRKDISMLQVAMAEHSRMIKGLEGGVKSLDIKVESLDAKVEKLDAKIDGVRTVLKEDMRQMESRLSAKIDGHSVRLDDHEKRISAIESAA